MSQPDAVNTNIVGYAKGGSPALCSQFRAGVLRHADAQSACLRGMRHTSICKSVRSRSAYDLLCGLALGFFLPQLFFIGDLLLPLFQHILFPLAVVLLLEEHGLLQRGMEALDGKLL